MLFFMVVFSSVLILLFVRLFFLSFLLLHFRFSVAYLLALAILLVVAALEEVSVLSSYLLHIVCEIFFLWVFFVVTWIRHALSFRIFFSCMFTSAAAKMFTLSGVGLGGFSKRRIVGKKFAIFSSQVERILRGEGEGKNRFSILIFASYM